MPSTDTIQFSDNYYTCERGSGISDTCGCEKGLEFLIHVDVKEVLEFVDVKGVNSGISDTCGRERSSGVCRCERG